jgi:hypothetical protein
VTRRGESDDSDEEGERESAGALLVEARVEGTVGRESERAVANGFLGDPVRPIYPWEGGARVEVTGREEPPTSKFLSTQ